MLSKREAAERNEKAGGQEKHGAVICKICPMVECPYNIANKNKNENIYGSDACFIFCKQWLADHHSVDGGWKDFVLSNLPNLTKEYEFQKEDCGEFFLWEMDNSKAVSYLFRGVLIRYRERHPEQKQPSHEEIMTKWFMHDNGVWFKVLEYQEGRYLCNYENADWVDSTYFTGRESATIPPEEQS